MVAKVLTLAVFMALAACQTPSGSFCAIARPQRLSAEAIAAMSDDDVRAALAHNRTGQALCGWKP